MVKSSLIYLIATTLSSLTAIEMGYDPLMVLMASIAAGYTVVNMPSIHWFKGILTVLVIVIISINLAPVITNYVLESNSVYTLRGIAVIIALFAQAIIVWGQKQIGLLDVSDVIIEALRKKLGADKPKGGK